MARPYNFSEQATQNLSQDIGTAGIFDGPTGPNMGDYGAQLLKEHSASKKAAAEAAAKAKALRDKELAELLSKDYTDAKLTDQTILDDGISKLNNDIVEAYTAGGSGYSIYSDNSPRGKELRDRMTKWQGYGVNSTNQETEYENIESQIDNDENWQTERQLAELNAKTYGTKENPINAGSRDLSQVDIHRPQYYNDDKVIRDRVKALSDVNYTTSGVEKSLYGEVIKTQIVEGKFMKPVLDAEGSPKMDASGNPVLEPGVSDDMANMFFQDEDLLRKYQYDVLEELGFFDNPNATGLDFNDDTHKQAFMEAMADDPDVAGRTLGQIVNDNLKKDLELHNNASIENKTTKGASRPKPSKSGRDKNRPSNDVIDERINRIRSLQDGNTVELEGLVGEFYHDKRITKVKFDKPENPEYIIVYTRNTDDESDNTYVTNKIPIKGHEGEVSINKMFNSMGEKVKIDPEYINIRLRDKNKPLEKAGGNSEVIDPLNMNGNQ